MPNNTAEIGDRSGHSFKIDLSTLSTLGRTREGLVGDQEWSFPRMTGLLQTKILPYRPLGDWRVLDKGFIRYNSGKLVWGFSTTGVTTYDIVLLNLDGTWGMKLFEYADALGVNDEGEGFVIQPWVLGFSPGKFSWTLV